MMAAPEIEDDLTRYVDMLPGGSIPLWGIRLVCYVDPDGTTMNDWLKDGDVRLGEIVGALEVVKHQLIQCVEEGD